MTPEQRKKWTIWFNAALLAALPVFEILINTLPQIQPYLPDNIYRAVGLFAVCGNMLLNMIKAVEK